MTPPSTAFPGNMLPCGLLVTCLFLVLCAPSAPADLVAHYPFDEPPAGDDTVIDSLGRNHAVLINSTSVTRGVAAHDPAFGTACDFALRGGVNLGTGTEVRPVDQFTMTWWMRPTTLNSFDRIYETMTGTSNGANGIRIDLGANPGDSVRVLLRDGNGSTSTQRTHSLNLRTDGTWYFVAVRYDSTAGDGSALKLTVLEELGTISGATVTAATESPTALGTGPIDLHSTGAFLAADDAAAAGSNDFGGALDDFAIFQTGDSFGILSDEDLAMVFNHGALAFDPPAPVPVINSFTASASSITPGSPVTLSWETGNADTLAITPGIGSVNSQTAEGRGSLELTPEKTTLYTLTATNDEGTASASVQVIVGGELLSPVISEFVALNRTSLLDGDGNNPDWIEIHNPNLAPLDLGGYFLTDDASEPTRWPFPPGTLVPGSGYLVVFASQQDRNDYIDAGGNLHTNFALRSDGEYLALVAPDGTTMVSGFSPRYPGQKEDVAYGPNGFFLAPTPGASNEGGGVLGFVEDTVFSVDRGFYEDPFTVTVTTTTPDAEIYYTTDGTEPSPANGTLYRTPVPVATTTTLRAAAFKEGFEPTNVDTQSYLFLADVLRQPDSIPGYPDTWAGKPAHYHMDPEVVNHPLDGPRMLEALQAFPSLSIAINPGEMFGRAGIYQNPQSQGDSWERSVSAEFISPDGSEPGFQVNAGMRVQGGSSRNPDIPKHSLSLRFRRDYGPGKLDYPLFRDAPFGDSAVEEFDFLQLRAGFNFAWTHRHYYQARHAQYNRDQWVNDLYLAMGQPGTHGRWVHLYLNGLYWGLYHVHERPDGDFMASYFGGESEDYDALSSGQPRSGDKDAWNTMMAIASSNISDPDRYSEIQDYLNVDSLIDYMLLNFFVGNTDWDGHNWRAARKRQRGAGYLMLPWDSEFAISPNGPGVINNPQPLSNALNTNVTNRNGTGRPSGLHQDLVANAEYRMRFADRAYRHLFNGGALSPTTAGAIWRARSDLMDRAVVAESARWGDFRYDVDPGRWQRSDFDRYTRNDHYLEDQAWILRTYIPRRGSVLLNQLRGRGLYPATSAPRFRQQGGNVALGQALTISNPNPGGTIYYTMDGSDPRDPGAGGNLVSADAIRYTGPPVFTSSALLRARVLNGTEWSALNEASFLAGSLADSSTLAVSELMYNPPGPSEDLEFVELVNLSDTATIELGHAEFVTGVAFTFPLNTRLAPGEHLLVVSNRAAFEAHYGSELPVAGEYVGLLDNDGEQLVIEDASGSILLDFTYNDGPQWPSRADGTGHSLVLRRPGPPNDPSDALNWRDSADPMGNPGSSDSTTFNSDPSADNDQDGLSALMEYATGSSDFTPGPDTTSPVLSLDQAGHLIVTVRLNLLASDLETSLEQATDLASWEPLSGFQRIAIDRDPLQNTALVTYRATVPLPDQPARNFLRLRVTRP
ncbi:MAG: lamin tail domain-containing protein [Roseibacillus sp.]|nr:lamin tail domain-containing protein [Roseibacillus sp.]